MTFIHSADVAAALAFRMFGRDGGLKVYPSVTRGAMLCAALTQVNGVTL
jgi:hypothetical protein